MESNKNKVTVSRRAASVAANESLTNDAAVDSSPSTPVGGESSEPTYCFCGQVSFGEMIACDNENVGLTWCYMFLIMMNVCVHVFIGSAKSNGFITAVLVSKIHQRANGTAVNVKLKRSVDW